MKSAEQIMYDLKFDLMHGKLNFEQVFISLDHKTGGVDRATAKVVRLLKDTRFDQIEFNSWLDNEKNWNCSRFTKEQLRNQQKSRMNRPAVKITI